MNKIQLIETTGGRSYGLDQDTVWFIQVTRGDTKEFVYLFWGRPCYAKQDDLLGKSHAAFSSYTEAVDAFRILTNHLRAKKQQEGLVLMEETI